MDMKEWWDAHDIKNLIKAGVDPLHPESEASQKYWQDFHQRLEQRECVLDERLMCSVVSLKYDFHNHCGQLHLQEGHCCDMSGCLSLFKGIDSEVVAVLTFSGDEPDTAYCKRPNGEWVAMRNL